MITLFKYTRLQGARVSGTSLIVHDHDRPWISDPSKKIEHERNFRRAI
jgi:hypothetical protein